MYTKNYIVGPWGLIRNEKKVHCIHFAQVKDKCTNDLQKVITTLSSIFPEHVSFSFVHLSWHQHIVDHLGGGDKKNKKTIECPLEIPHSAVFWLKLLIIHIDFRTEYKSV